MGLAHAAGTEKVQRFLSVSLELMQPVACAMLTSDYAAQAGDLLPLLLPTLGAVSEQLGPACKLQHQHAVWMVCRCVFLFHLVLLANMPSCTGHMPLPLKLVIAEHSVLYHVLNSCGVTL